MILAFYLAVDLVNTKCGQPLSRVIRHVTFFPVGIIVLAALLMEEANGDMLNSVRHNNIRRVDSLISWSLVV